MTIPRLIPVTGICLLLIGPAARPAHGQLISPGELSDAHSELEGIRSCTSCHQLRSKGIDADLCLDCHEPLRARIESGSGYHVASDATSACARCHKEHFGRDFTLVRWDPSEFDHSEIGWAPEGAHTVLDCRECHRTALVQSSDVHEFKGRYGALSRTYLGLETACLACHRGDNPHGDQFAGQTCDSCHGQDGWEDPAGFDHDGTRYRLTGLHTRVECAGCHPPRDAGMSAAERAAAPVSDLQFTGLPFRQCTSCHRDEHDGGMGATCSACHTTAGWHQVGEDELRGRFDHAAGFPLEGAHADAECSVCHGRPAHATESVRIRYPPGSEGRAYPSPAAESCASCHIDEHDGEFASSPAGGACDGCHTQDEWYPAGFDVRRHNAESRFRLEGVHVAIPCVACHPGTVASSGASATPRFRIGLREACVDCHAADDPHGGQFEDRPCDACHSDRTFSIDGFDHDRARYQLDGAHRGLACAECHPSEPAPGGGQMTRFKPLASECTDCHGGGA
jgi:hypothetical protein